MKTKSLPLEATLSLIATVLGLGLSFGFASAPAWAQTTYRVTDLGTLGGTWSEPLAMNDAGQVTGHSSTSGDAEVHAFLWDGAYMQDLGAFGGTDGAGVAINAAGQVAGWASGHAFLWDGVTMRDINPPGAEGSYAYDINDSGQVAMTATFGAELWPLSSHGFLFDGTTLHDLGSGTQAHSINKLSQVTGVINVCCSPWGYYDTHAALWNGNTVLDFTLQTGGTNVWKAGTGDVINDSGQVTGEYGEIELDANGYPVPGGGMYYLFLWDGTTVQLGTLDGGYCFPHAMNNSGVMTGQCYLKSEWPVSHAVVFDGTTMRDLGTLGGTYAWGSAINTAGQVVGDSYTAGDVDYHPFLWDGTAMHDLNDLVAPLDSLKPYVTLIGTQGTFINASGKIVADGVDSRTSQSHAYLLSPIRALNFAGFFSPVDNIPTRNLAKAGSAIPVKFSLGGDQGLDIFEAGYPRSQQIDCNTSAPLDSIEETVNPGSSSLSYAAGADRYQYVWKTQTAWVGTCRQLVIRFSDLTERVANFQFK